jgi:hypothetical protein
MALQSERERESLLLLINPNYVQHVGFFKSTWALFKLKPGFFSPITPFFKLYNQIG